MRYTPEQKRETGSKILAAAERSFRTEGFGGAGVDGLAKEAGVTSGAFYKHFPSKAAAFDAAVVAGLAAFQMGLQRSIENKNADWMQGLVDYYFSEEHISRLESSCVVPSLTGEIARAGPNTKRIYEEGIQKIVDTVASGLLQVERKNRSARAWAMISMLSGGVQIVRAIENETIKAAVAANLKQAVLSLGSAKQN
jgi:TetR/AcrR family transcriptional regulator, transcriptional repressor for nem operon